MAVPIDSDIHCMVNNYATHSHPKIKAWLVSRPQWHMHFEVAPEKWSS